MKTLCITLILGFLFLWNYKLEVANQHLKTELQEMVVRLKEQEVVNTIGKEMIYSKLNIREYEPFDLVTPK
jgi:hypothetical protein